jgi:hypothetical protein
MTEDKDRTSDPSYDDLIIDIRYQEPELNYEALLRWSERYPQYHKDFEGHFATSAIMHMYADAEPQKEDDPSEDDWLDGRSLALMNHILRRQKEGIRDDVTLSLSAIEQLVLTAIALLRPMRLRHLENIVAKVKERSRSEVPDRLVIETLQSLETRYALFSYSPDEKYPEVGGKQFFMMTEIGQLSLEASSKDSSGD